MKQILAITAFQLKMALKSWKAAIALLVVPLLVVGGIALVISKVLAEDEVVQLFDIAIVDQDATFETKYVIQQLLKSEHLTKVTNIIETDGANAERLLEDNEIAAIVTIPEGFSRSVKIGENTPVMVIGSSNRPLQAQLVRHLLESAADFTSAAQSGINTVYYFTSNEMFSKEERQAAYTKSLLTYSLHILGRGEMFDVIEKDSLYQQNVLQYYAISLFLLLLMIWSFGWLQIIAKAMNSLRLRLLSRGVTEEKVTLATLFSLFILLLPISVVGSILLSSYPEVEVYRVLFIVGNVVLSCTFAVFFIMLNSIFKDQRVYLLVGIVVLIFGAFAGGTFIPTVYLPNWLGQIGSFSLNHFSLQFLLAIFNEASSMSEQFRNVSLLAIGFLLLAFIGLRLNKRRWSR